MLQDAGLATSLIVFVGDCDEPLEEAAHQVRFGTPLLAGRLIAAAN